MEVGIRETFAAASRTEPNQWTSYDEGSGALWDTALSLPLASRSPTGLRLEGPGEKAMISLHCTLPQDPCKAN